MNKSFLIIILCAAFTLFSAPKREHLEHELLLNELQKVKTDYESVQSNLRIVTDNRWAHRQKQVDQKAKYQQSIEMLQGEIERRYGEIARIREEILIREGSLLAAESNYKELKEQFKGIPLTVESILRKEEDNVRSGFPLGQQERSVRLQNVMSSVTTNSEKVLHNLNLIQKYMFDNLNVQVSSGVSKETVVLSDNSVYDATVIRLGTVAAFGMNDTGSAFYLGHISQNGTSPYEWVRLTDPRASEHLVAAMPEWLKNQAVNGNVYVDVLQNNYSGDLLGVEKKSTMDELKKFVKAGGVVMVPLGLICLWALILLINRLIVYSKVHSFGNQFIDKTVEFLDQKRFTEAQDFAQSSKGVLARILSTCLKHSKWKRPFAEKAVKEFLLAEVPALDKHLDTLAVLAGAAPLLGLLGTVTGMISMFESITRFGTGDPKLLAGGISEALVTTEVGLIIAIPVLLIHNFLRNRRNHIQADMEMYAMKILNRLWPEE